MSTAAEPQSPPEFLEHRLSEHTFRRYEPLLEVAVKEFPAETQFFVPADLAPTTFLCRFRDSRVSLIRYNWPSTVDREKLLAIMSQHVISLSPDHKSLSFRQKGPQGRPPLLGTSPTVSQSTVLHNWGNASKEEVYAGCLLIAHKRIEGPIVFTGKMEDGFIAATESALDVSLVYNPTTKETIIT
jgi:hypothetical protein